MRSRLVGPGVLLLIAAAFFRHLLPAEVLVDDGQWTLIRRRQTIDDVLALEL